MLPIRPQFPIMAGGGFLLVCACTVPDRATTPFGAGGGTADAGDPSTDGPSPTGPSTDGSGDDDGSGGSTGGGIYFDTPNGNPGGGDDGTGDVCESVDLLFVIDNSPSMENDVINLINSFPGFVSGIQASITTTSAYHIGVTTTDETLVQPNVAPECAGLGVLIEHSAAGYCGPYASGGNYFTEDDDIASAFECAATHGSQGSASERPIDSARLALGDAFNGPGGCNDGFVRNDALLVLVLITDEDDSYSAGVPTEWYQHFLDLKQGLEDNIVVLSILMGPGAPPECNVNLNGPGTDLTAFTRMFENGHVGDICQPDFSPFFAEAADHIGTAFEDCYPIPEG
jgi:hypothetical protein